MAVTYTWEITGLKTTTVANTDNVVVQTYWKKIGTDENGNTGEFSGATPFPVDPSFVGSNNFINFSKLTEQTVLSWIQGVVINDYEVHVNEQIQNQINNKVNPVVDATIPWAPAPVSNVATSNT
jgi:hypothetical protein